jgi:hypothetical protein
LGIFVVALIIGLGLLVYKSGSQDNGDKMSFWVTLANNLGTILATLVAVWAAVQALSRAMIIRSPQAAQSYIETATDSSFATLLEPNPRAMKRLVNAYSVNRALSTLGHLDIP